MASISTPVWALVRASAVSVTLSSPTSAVRSTNESGSGWQSGTRSAVRLAAWMPAMRAVPSTSPFGALPSRTAAAVVGLMRTTARASARRSVTSLPPTSTIRARPASPMWESSGGGMRLLRGPDQVAHRGLVAPAQQLDGVGLPVHDRLEEELPFLVGRERPLCPAAHLVQQHREARVGLPVLVRDLVADPLGESRRGAGGGDRDRQGAASDDRREDEVAEGRHVDHVDEHRP